MPKTKIFCDIADSKTIKEFNKKSIVNGFTTNPSLMRKAGAKSYEKYSKLLLKICKKKPISLEVFSDDHESMINQGVKINSDEKFTNYIHVQYLEFFQLRASFYLHKDKFLNLNYCLL